MSILNVIEQEAIKKGAPRFGAGDTVKIQCRVKEGDKERLQAFEGVVIKRQGEKLRETFTVRRIVQGIGVERTFPIHSPLVENIEVLRRGRVRRAKIYYLRDRIGTKSRRIQEKTAA